MIVPDQTADAQLVRMSVTGDRLAFEEIVRRNLTSVSAVAFALTGDRCTSEDVTQEVFLTAWQRLKDLRDPSKLRGWLCVIAQNVSNTFGRKTARDPLRKAADLEAASELATNAPSPAEIAISAEQQQLAWSAIERIPETYRVPLVLFYREGQSVAQVGSALELTDEAVRQRLSRARSMLKDEVAKMVETSITAYRPNSLLVTTIMAGIAGTALQAGAATAATAAVTKLAGGTVTAGTTSFAALLGAILGPLQIAGGVFRSLIAYRTGQSPEERQLILRYLIQIPCVILVWAEFHVVLIMASNRGLLTYSQSVVALILEVVLLLAVLFFLHRRHKKQHYALLKAHEQDLTPVQARRLHLMEASPREREAGMFSDAIENIRQRPYTAAYAAHGGLLFAGLAWVVADGAFRHDTTLMLGILLAITFSELIAVAFTIRKPQNYLLHRAVMFLSVVPIIGCVVGYWHAYGITNALLTTPPENWFAMRLLPLLVCIAYVVLALFQVAKHLGLSPQR